MVILDGRALIDIEYTALKMLIEAEEKLRSQGITLWLASLNPEVLKVVQQSPLGETLGRARMFFNLQSAVTHYEQLHSKPTTSTIALVLALPGRCRERLRDLHTKRCDALGIRHVGDGGNHQSLIREHQKRGGAAHGVARCATIRADAPFSCTRSTFQPSAKSVDAPDARRRGVWRSSMVSAFNSPGFSHRRPEPCQIRWRREIRAGAEQTRVVTPRRLLHAQLRVHIRPWEVERRGVRELTRLPR